MSDLAGISPEAKPIVEVETLPYVSKSRVKTYLQCPRKFWWKYWCGVRPPTNWYMQRGTEVHETFEEFHLNLLAFVAANQQRPEVFTQLLPDRSHWQQWIEMVGNFFAFEERRWVAAQRVLDRWTPIEVEAEAWLGEPPASWVEQQTSDYTIPDYVSAEPPVGDIPWMGRADLIVDTRSVPGVDGNGVTIIDYKTGSVPDEQYRDEGIFLEGEYYGTLFEEFFDIDAVAGYYPSADELIVSTYPNTDRRRDIKRAVLGMQREPEIGNFPTDQSPLCHYNNAKNEGQCHFHPICEVRHDCRHCDTDLDGDTSGNAARYNGP